MDPITHGLLGATVAKVATWRRVPTGAAIIGAVAGMAPDIDVLWTSATDPTVAWQYHRHLTHALAAIPVGGLLVALPFLFLRQYKQFRGGVIAAAIFGYATHTLLDSLTSYGTQQFLPWSDFRVARDAMPIVDPLYTLILALGLFISSRTKRITPMLWSLALALLYTAFGFWQHGRATALQHELMARRGQNTIQQARVMPAPGWLMFWRSVYIANGQLFADGMRVPWIGEAKVLEGGAVKVASAQDLPAAAQANPETMRQFKVFDWFAGGYLAPIAGASNGSVALGDLRITSAVESLTPLWGLQFDATTGAASAWQPAPNQTANFAPLLRGLLLGDDRFQPLPMPTPEPTPGRTNRSTRPGAKPSPTSPSTQKSPAAR